MKMSKRTEESILNLVSSLSVEAVAELSGVEPFHVMDICARKGIQYRQASADQARFEVLTYRLTTEGYDEQVVKERNLISLKIYREAKGRRRIKFDGLAEKSIDEYLI